MFIDYKIKNNIERMGINVFSKNYVSSTNDYLNYGYIRDQAPIIVLANNQRHPRGRRGKKWVNFQGSSLGFSLCLRFNKSLNEYFVLSHLVGISIIQACKAIGDQTLTIKWPNDIMQDDKKVCGTLIENLIDSKNSFYSMIGFGFNISIPDSLINFIDGYPANLNIEKNNVDLLAGTTASVLLQNISLFEKSGFIPFQKIWNEYMYAKNKNVILTSKDKEVSGKLLGINIKGELQIQTNKKIVNCVRHQLFHEVIEMKILIDIGNTTTSLGLWKNNKLSMTNNIENNKLFITLKKYLKRDIDEILFTSVIGTKENKLIIDRLKKIFKSNIKQIKSSSSLLGVSNGYIQPKKLGDDRWATIVASSLLHEQPLIIVDCGTAISIDVVSAKGIHLGGYILGGFDGYSRSFKNAYHLKNIKIKEGVASQKKYFPKKTEDGITEGYLLMVISAIENTYNQVKKNQNTPPKLLISGGYGKIISKRLSVKNKYEPDLVLKSIGLIGNHL